SVGALLYQRAMTLGRELEAEYIELRNSYVEQCLGESNVSRYVTFTQQTEADESKLLESLPKKTRNMVRKALRYSYTTRIQTSDFRSFQDLYARSMRRLGTPNFPSRHFARLKANFGEMIDVREVLLDNKVVAASLNFYFRDQMHVYYAASDPAYNDKAA